MSTKRVSPDDPIYPPKKRALYEHKRQEELLKRGNGKSNFEESSNEFLAMKIKLESSDLICMRPRSDSLQSMHSLISDHSFISDQSVINDQSDQSNSTGSRESSPNIFDSRTPERNPVEFYKMDISKPLFPDVERAESEVHNERPVEKNGFKESKEKINSEFTNETNPLYNNLTQITACRISLDKNFNELLVNKYDAKKELNRTEEKLSESEINQSQTATLHLSEQTSLTEKSMYVGPMVSLISRFNKEVVTNHVNPNISNIVCTNSDSSYGDKDFVENRTQGSLSVTMADSDLYKCRICDKKFGVHDHLKAHMQDEHSGPLPYKCQHCPRAFGQYNNLQRHLRVHRAKIYKCKLCDREFNEEFYLKMHMGTHTGKRVYSCGVCSASFSSNQDLKLHVKTHSPSQLHTCDVCGKSFSKACVLRQHKKGHSGERPHKCDKCPKTFIHRHHLTMHLKSHTETKQYTCDICKKEFYQSSHLYKHLKCHEDSQNVTGESSGRNEHVTNDDVITGIGDKNTRKETVVQSNRIILNKLCDKLTSKNKQLNQRETSPAYDTTTQKLPSLSEAFYPSQRRTNLPIYENSYSSLGQQTMTAYSHHRPIHQGPYYPYQQQNLPVPMNSHMQAYHDYVYVKQMIEKVKNSQTDSGTKKYIVKQPKSRKEYNEKELNSTNENAEKQLNSTKEDNETEKQLERTKECIVNKGNNLVRDSENKKPVQTHQSDTTGETARAICDAEISASEAAIGLIKMSGSIGNDNETNNVLKSWQQSLGNLEKTQSSNGHKQSIQPSDQIQNSNNKTLNWHTPFHNSPVNNVMSSMYAASTTFAPLYYGSQSQPPLNPTSSLMSLDSTYNYPQNLHHSVIPGHYSINRQYPYYNMGLTQYQNSHYYPVHNLWGGQEHQRSHRLPMNLASPNSPKKRHYSSQDVYTLKKPKQPDDDSPLSHMNRQRHMSESPKIQMLSENVSTASGKVITSTRDKPEIEHFKNIQQSAHGQFHSLEANPIDNVRNDVNSYDRDESTMNLVIKDTIENCKDDCTESIESVYTDGTESIENIYTGFTESIENVYTGEKMNNKFKTEKSDTHSEIVTEFSTLAEPSSANNCTERLVGSDLRIDLSYKDEDIEIEGTDITQMSGRNIVNKTSIIPEKEGFRESETHVDEKSCVDSKKDIDYNEIGDEGALTGERGTGYIDTDTDNVNEGESYSIEMNGANHIKHSRQDKTKADTEAEELGEQGDEIIAVAKYEEFGKKGEKQDEDVNYCDNTSDNLVSIENISAIHDSSGALDLSLREQNQKIQNLDNVMNSEASKEPESSYLDHGLNESSRKPNGNMKSKLDKLHKAELQGEVSSPDVYNMCGICWKGFDNKTDLQNHQIEHAQKLENNNKCQICGRTFVKLFDLQCHIMKHRQESLNTITKMKGYLTPTVGNSKSQSELRNQSVSGNGDNQNETLALQTGSRYESKGNSWMLSKNCVGNQPSLTGYRYGNYKSNKMEKYKVDQSITKQTGPGVVKQTGSTKENTIRQTKTGCRSPEMDQSSNKYKCEICLRDFAHKHNLARHKMSHNQKSFKCSYCERSFKEKFYLQMHEKTHTDENIQDCEICGESVPKVKYWRHTNEHLGTIIKNPTYEQIGHRVNELLMDKQNNKNLNTNIDTRKVLGERKENVLNSKGSNLSVRKSMTSYSMNNDGFRRNEENFENLNPALTKVCLMQKQANSMFDVFKLKNCNF